MALSNKQRAFVEHYIITWNASEAARRAGYSQRFPAHNMGQAEINAYNTQWFKVQGAPLVVNGISYPSPFLAGAIFQCSPDQRWAGYSVEPALPIVWKA